MCNFSKTKRKIIAKHPETTALKDIDAAEKKLSNAVTKRLSNKKEKINFDLNIYFIHSLYPSWNTEFRNVEIINTLFIKKKLFLETWTSIGKKAKQIQNLRHLENTVEKSTKPQVFYYYYLWNCINMCLNMLKYARTFNGIVKA